MIIKSLDTETFRRLQQLPDWQKLILIGAILLIAATVLQIIGLKRAKKPLSAISVIIGGFGISIVIAPFISNNDTVINVGSITVNVISLLIGVLIFKGVFRKLKALVIALILVAIIAITSTAFENYKPEHIKHIPIPNVFNVI